MSDPNPVFLDFLLALFCAVFYIFSDTIPALYTLYIIDWTL